ncbi:VanZ family protein [Solibacillus sp. FSL H8-0538]|uniref:VanZ family protein n=1 Tax=Solibacillus sp. FSL H8-0538 TaxID=2921400 RepID=UPI0030F919B1
MITAFLSSMMFYMVCTFPLYIVARVVYVKWRRVHLNLVRELLLALFSLYAIAISSQTIIPHWSIGVDSETGKLFVDMHLRQYKSYNFVPFSTIEMYFVGVGDTASQWSLISVYNLAGNVILFVPIGLFVPLLWQRWRTWLGILMVAIAVPFFIEFIQYFIGRSSDVDDLILNAVGIMWGYFVYKLFAAILSIKR